jgi:hypothetical protein
MKRMEAPSSWYLGNIELVHCDSERSVVGLGRGSALLHLRLFLVAEVGAVEVHNEVCRTYRYSCILSLHFSSKV